ncbi:MAG: hypothetical protein WAK67_05870 [Xanthobacteraceae bacterium]
MFRSMKLVKFIAVVAALMSIMLVGATQSQAQTGTVRLNIVKAGFIVGAGGGSGVLHYHGRTYRLTVGGIGLGSLGVAAADLVGTASNLHRPQDIAGTYGAAGAGATFIGGGQVATLQNEKGVMLQLHGGQVGFQVSLGLAGMTIGLR